MSEFSLEEAQKLADLLIARDTGKHLSDTEIIVFQGSWHNKKYEEIARESGYSAEYINKDVGNKLWHKLSDVLKEEVSKRNFKQSLWRRWSNENIPPSLEKSSDKKSLREIPFPDGCVPPDSPFYIERSELELRCDREILKQGSLTRIKAPHLMGKTSLLKRLEKVAERNRHIAVYLDLKEIELQKLGNLEQLLKWICFKVCRSLKLKDCLKEYWDTEILGSNDNCTFYFEEYILSNIDNPLVLELDNVDVVFPYSEVIDDFFGMLRSWHEKAKTSAIWQQLKLVIAHSTEAYITLDINHSPFNAGLPLELQEFNLEQILRLKQLHSIDLTEEGAIDLMELVGGHPYLIRLALYNLTKNPMSMREFLNNAPNESGIYCHHLRGLQETLKTSPQLTESYRQVVNNSEAVRLDSMQIYKLHSLGLVKVADNRVIPRCSLYRQYFARVL